MHAEVRCPDCGEELAPEDVLSSPAPGASISRAEHIPAPVLSALERERALLDMVGGITQILSAVFLTDWFRPAIRLAFRNRRAAAVDYHR